MITTKTDKQTNKQTTKKHKKLRIKNIYKKSVHPSLPAGEDQKHRNQLFNIDIMDLCLLPCFCILFKR